MESLLSRSLKAARIRKGWSQQQLASALQVSRAAVGQWENGVTDPSTDNLIKACRLLDIPMDRIAEAQPSLDPQGETILRGLEMDTATQFSRLLGRVPVYGIASAGNDAEFYNNGEVIDSVRRPSGIENARNVYAIYVVGDSMSPRYEEGDLVFINPQRTPAPGDYVVVQLQPEEGERASRGFLKRLVKRGSEKIICAQFNPAKTVEFAAKNVGALHRVIPWNELLGS